LGTSSAGAADTARAWKARAEQKALKETIFDGRKNVDFGVKA
jgi:hypothetical protein